MKNRLKVIVLTAVMSAFLTCQILRTPFGLEMAGFIQDTSFPEDVMGMGDSGSSENDSRKNTYSNKAAELAFDILEYYNTYHLTDFELEDLMAINQGIDLEKLKLTDDLQFPWEVEKSKLRSSLVEKEPKIKLQPERIRHYVYFDQRRYDNLEYWNGNIDNYGCIPVSVAISLSSIDSRKIYYVEDIVALSKGKYKSLDFYMKKIGPMGFRAIFTMNPNVVLGELKKAARKSTRIMVIAYGEKKGEWLSLNDFSKNRSALCQPFYSDGHVIVISDLVEDDGQQFLFTLDPNDPNNNRYWDSRIVFDGAILFYIIQKKDIDANKM
ncbi:MAG: hypothetical protein JXR70_07410 [Spirochaetales bacterium]|nr:hypothetical protein [Spirochaetales bacterium]